MVFSTQTHVSLISQNGGVTLDVSIRTGAVCTFLFAVQTIKLHHFLLAFQ
jgi:hypothetical protein